MQKRTKLLIKRDLKTELLRAWEKLPPPQEVLTLRQDLEKLESENLDGASDIIYKHIGSASELAGMLDDRLFASSASEVDVLDRRSLLMFTRQEAYIELQILKLEVRCKRYKDMMKSNKVMERPILIKPEDIALFRLADMIADDPRGSLKDTENKPAIENKPVKEDQPPQRKTKIIILKNNEEVKVVMIVESSTSYTVKTIDGKMREIQKNEVREVKE
jgi:hypothetical protein